MTDDHQEGDPVSEFVPAEEGRLRQLEAAARNLRINNLELSVLNSISVKVGSAMDLSEAAYILRKQLIHEMSVVAGCIFTWNTSLEAFTLRESWGIDESAVERLQTLRIVNLPCYALGRTSGISSPGESACGEACPFDQAGIEKGCVVVPLVARGATQGLLLVRGDNSLNIDQPGFYRSLGYQVGIAFERARLFEQIAIARARSEQLSNSIVHIQETERRTIARELHDEIGSSLTGLKLILELGLRAPESERSRTLQEARQLVSELMARVRQLSLDLRPGMLDDLGIIPALVWYFERFTSQTRVHVRFTHSDLDGVRFSQPVETAIYRIVQEALTNVARHAGVAEVNVNLWRDADIAYLEISDAGKGFDLRPLLGANQSSGLAGMGERARLLGGGLTIESEPGRGTRITANLPV